MISAVSHITRYVHDAEEALKFYTEVLGFQKQFDGDAAPGMRWLTVSAPDQPGLEMVLFDPKVWYENEAKRNEALAMIDRQPQLIFTTQDIDGALVRLKEAGVDLVTPEVRDLPWGRDLVFRDITGSSINLVQVKPQPVLQ